MIAVLLAASIAFPGDPANVNWPSFRGPDACGVSGGPQTPRTWNVATGQNIAWKTPIPGLGLSSPVIWGDRVFVTTAVMVMKPGDDPKPGDEELKVGLYGDIGSVDEAREHSWRVYCLDRLTGKVLWEREAHRGVPRIKRHPKASHANCTPATDGSRVVIFFGSEGLYCYDFDGKLIWKRDLGVLDAGYFAVPKAQWEFGSSPVIDGDRVIVQCDVQRGSFLAALSLKDGSDIWRTPRQEVPTWSSPAVTHDAAGPQIIVNGWKHIGGYDLQTGKEIWKLVGGGDIPVPTPIVDRARGVVYITNAHGMMAPIYAIRLDAKGELAAPAEGERSAAVAWMHARRGNYMQTPILVGDLLYCCNDMGVLSVFEAASGSEVYRKRIGAGMTGFTASPVACGDLVYFTSEEGDVYVLRAGREFKKPRKNALGELCMATPAIKDGMLVFRGRHHVIAVAGKPTAASAPARDKARGAVDGDNGPTGTVSKGP